MNSDTSDNELHADLTRSVGSEHLNAVLSEGPQITYEEYGAKWDEANRETFDPYLKRIIA